MMEQQYPCIDKDGNIPLEWSVDYDFENLIGEEKSRAAVVEAAGSALSSKVCSTRRW